MTVSSSDLAPDHACFTLAVTVGDGSLLLCLVHKGTSLTNIEASISLIGAAFNLDKGGVAGLVS